MISGELRQVLAMRLDEIFHQRAGLAGIGHGAIGKQRLDEEVAVAGERRVDRDLDRRDLGVELGDQRCGQGIGNERGEPVRDG